MFKVKQTDKLGVLAFASSAAEPLRIEHSLCPNCLDESVCVQAEILGYVARNEKLGIIVSICPKFQPKDKTCLDELP